MDSRNRGQSYNFRIKTSELKTKITLVLNVKGDGKEKDDDGKPIRNKTISITTRAKLRYAYGTEYDTTEKERNIQKITFFVRKRKSLKELDFRGKVIFDNKEFNIKYVNVINDNILEIRGEYYGEHKV